LTCGRESKIINLKLIRLPVPNVAFLRVEVDTDFHEFPPIDGVGNKITPIVNLRKGLFGTAIQPKLEDINVVGSFHDGIGSSFGTSYFGLEELSHELENEVKMVW